MPIIETNRDRKANNPLEVRLPIIILGYDMNLQEAKALVGKTVEFSGAFRHIYKAKIFKVREFSDIIVAELDDGSTVINIELLRLLD